MAISRNDDGSVSGRAYTRAVGGFTLIELVVVIIILGILAVIAVPRFIAFQTQARLASIKTLSVAVQTAAEHVHMACQITPGCDLGNYNSFITIGGKLIWINYGYPNAGDNLNDNQIDAWVAFQGFTASLPNAAVTLFTLDDAPDPANCAVSYQDAYNGTQKYVLTVLTSGC